MAPTWSSRSRGLNRPSRLFAAPPPNSRSLRGSTRASGAAHHDHYGL